MTGTMGASGLVAGAAPARGTMTVRAAKDFLDRCVAQSRACYEVAMGRAVVQRALHRFRRDYRLDRARSVAHAADAPTITLVNQLMRLFQAGATETELRQLAAFPLRAIERLLSGSRSLDELDAEETMLDGSEDHLQMRRRIHRSRPAGLSPAALREEADARDAFASLNNEQARALRAEADRMEQTRGLVA
jgi:carboxylesterase type B